MPELPEVETVRRGLAPFVLGRTIAGVEIIDPRIVRRQSGGPDVVRETATGARITAAVRRGKFLWLRLAVSSGELGEALMIHLGMSGQLRVRRADGTDATAPPDLQDRGRSAGSELRERTAGAPAVESEGPAPDPDRHRRLSLRLDSGDRVDMVDQRIFGGLWTSPLAPAADGATAGEGSPDALLPAAASAIARDPLDPAFDRAAVAATIRSRRAPVKSLLLAQDIVSGIGNIYADEALWRARVRFDSPGESLSQRRALSLLDSAREVMEEALAAGGTSFDALYVDVNGRSGYFSRSLDAYGRDGQPCRRCGRLMRRAVHQGRSSRYCPGCQRRPAAAPARPRRRP